MVKVSRLFMQGRSVENKVKWRHRQDAIESSKCVGKDSGQSLDFELLDLLEAGGMPLRQDPDLKRKPRSERNDREELPVFGDDSGVIPALLPDDVAVDAPLLVLVVFPAASDFRSDVRRHHGYGSQL